MYRIFSENYQCSIVELIFKNKSNDLTNENRS